MPRIWMDYCQFLMEQNLITRTRQAFDRALRALPITQHHRIWPLYLTFVKRHDIPETAVRVFRRYLKVMSSSYLHICEVGAVIKMYISVIFITAPTLPPFDLLLVCAFTIKG